MGMPPTPDEIRNHNLRVQAVEEGRVQLKRDGTRWRKGGEVKGKLANGVGSQYASHYLGTWCIQHYYSWCAHLGCQWSTELTPRADLNGLVLFARKKKYVFCACAITFQTQSTTCLAKFPLLVYLTNVSFLLRRGNSEHVQILAICRFTTDCQ